MAKHKNEQKQSIYLAAHGNYSGLCLNYRPKSKRILDLLIEKAFSSYDPKIGGLENTSELCDLGVPPAYVVTLGWDKSCPPLSYLPLIHWGIKLFVTVVKPRSI